LVPKTASLLRVPDGGAAPIAEVLLVLADMPFDPALPPEAQPFLEIHVLDEGPDPMRRRRLEQALEGKPVRLASIKLAAPARAAGADADGREAITLANLGALDPEAIMLQAHVERYGAAPEPALLAALREILATPGEEEKEA
jgi:exonuclease SbcD